MNFGKKRAPTKWIAFHRLCKALSADECAICVLVARECEQHMEMLFHEGIMDPGVRLGLHEAYGFCNAHAWMALRTPAADAGLAIVYDDLIRMVLPHITELARLRDKQRASHAFTNLLHNAAPPVLPATATCPVCASNEQTARLYLHELLDFFNDADLHKKYFQSFGICLPHLRQALREFPDDPQLPPLLDAERDKLVALQTELQEYNRKRDYRYANEPKGVEQTSWRRVIEKFVGKREMINR